MQIVIVVSGGFVVFFFFKPMTAYEMRMSDWSSDVCSSDLPRNRQRRESYLHAPAKAEYPISIFPIVELNGHAPVSPCRARTERRGDHNRLTELFRSEEHTSELQSLMRISYAVFCLKKKTTITTATII